MVYGILSDADHRLWLGTNRGLSRGVFSGSEPPFRNYGATDGVGNTEFNRHAAYRGADGTLYFGGLDGLTYSSPHAIDENVLVPPVVFTSIETASREGVRPHNPRGLKRLDLTYRDYSLAFEFAALSFTNPARNRYAYRLERFDRDWIDAGTRRFARYTDLPPGDYVFRVRGSNNDGVWNQEGVSLALSIAPPFWNTWLFRAAMVVAVLLAAGAAYRARVTRLVEIERLRFRIAGDLHDDLSSNLVGIALLGERLQQGPHVGAAERRQLNRISETARTMVQDLRDIVWLVDPSRDHLEDLLGKMQDLAATLLPSVEWVVRTDPVGATGRVALAVRRQLYLAYKEIMHNIARHAQASRVTVELTVQDGEFLLQVGDDGVGFEPGAATAGFGLRSVRQRVEELGGRLDLTSAPGRGTSVAVRVPVT